MVQSILFFLLGFLVAGFLVVLVAPAAWRRAGVLTKRRVEAAMPLTTTEIQADKDRLRAEFAVTARRLEMEAKALKDKSNVQFIEINRVRDELKQLAGEGARKDQTISAMGAVGGDLQDKLQQRDAEIARLTARVTEVERTIAQKAEEIEKLGRMYEEASFSSSNRQIELVARESEIEKLNNDVSVLRAQRKEVEKRHQEIATEGKAAVEALSTEKKKLADREKKLERLLSTLADRDETLDRRDRELTRLREDMKKNGVQLEAANREPGAGAGGEPRRDAERTAAQLSPLFTGVGGVDTEKVVAKLNNDRERLEARLATLARENKRLRAGLSAFDAGKSGGNGKEQREGAQLREQMQDLAAEVVSLAAALEGPNSEVAKVLATAETSSGREDGTAMRSIAERVQALQKTTSPS